MTSKEPRLYTITLKNDRCELIIDQNLGVTVRGPSDGCRALFAEFYPADKSIPERASRLELVRHQILNSTETWQYQDGNIIMTARSNCGVEMLSMLGEQIRKQGGVSLIRNVK